MNEAVGIVNAERSPDSRPTTTYQDLEIVSLKAAVVARDEEILQLRRVIRSLTGVLVDDCSLSEAKARARDEGLDVIHRRRPVDLNQIAVNAAGSAAVLDAIRGAGVV